MLSLHLVQLQIWKLNNILHNKAHQSLTTYMMKDYNHMLNHMISHHNLIIIKKIMGTIRNSLELALKTLQTISWVRIFEHWSLLMRTCKVCPYFHLHPFTKVLLTVLPLMTLSMKSNLLFLMNNLNHKNMDEYLDN